MFTLIFNNTFEVNINSFNRNTNFTSENIFSTGYISIVPDNNIITELYDLANSTITSITIKRRNEVIYNITDLNASITSIDEALNMDNMNINVNILFNI